MTIEVRAWSLREALDKVSVQEYMHKYAGTQELTDTDGTRWVHDQGDDTYQPISPEGDASVPMPKIVFQMAYPELYALFHPEAP